MTAHDDHGDCAPAPALAPAAPAAAPCAVIEYANVAYFVPDCAYDVRVSKARAELSVDCAL